MKSTDFNGEIRVKKSAMMLDIYVRTVIYKPMSKMTQRGEAVTITGGRPAKMTIRNKEAGIKYEVTVTSHLV